jgi:hypothetical protein
MRVSSILAAAVATGLATSAFAVVVPTVYEDFTTNSDGRWIGVNNRNPANNFGFSNTDNTGTTPAAPSTKVSAGGEMGGPNERGNLADYGFSTGNIAGTDTLHADGVYRFGNLGSGTWFFGWYNASSHMSAGGDPRNFVGLQFDDSRDIYSHIAKADDRVRGGRHTVLPTDATIQWTMDYDGAALSGVINGVAYSVNAGGSYMTGVTLNRFGLFTSSASGPVGGGYFDDITFSSLNPVPEPASLGLLALGGLTAMRRRK